MIRVAGAGWPTLLYKELLRFWKVAFQTIAAPVLTALLYLLIFSHVLESHVTVYGGEVRYTAFLIPGLVMMSVLQNAFANSSSSLIQSKITGNLIFMLLPPLSPGDLFAAYVLGAMVRGLVVGLGVFVVTLFFVPSLLAMPHPFWALAFALLGSAILGTLGLHRRHVGRQVRPARGVPELHHRSADVPVRRVLLDPFAAAVLAGGVPLEPVLLYDRRVPLRVFRACPTCRRRSRSPSSPAAAPCWRRSRSCCCAAAGSCATEPHRSSPSPPWPPPNRSNAPSPRISPASTSTSAATATTGKR